MGSIGNSGAQTPRRPQSRPVFVKNEAESASYLFYVTSENIYIDIRRSRARDVARAREGLSPRLLSSSVLSPFSFSPRPTSDLGEWNKFRVSEKLESLGGRRHFPWTPGKLLIPRHLLFNQGRVSAWARWEEGELSSESRWEVGAATLPSGYR